MTEKVDQEIDAIKTILTVLEPLEANVKTTVLEYVLKRLQIQPDQLFPQLAKHLTNMVEEDENDDEDQSEIHIKTFKETKKPKSANEMAAIVAYWLEHLAPKNDRKTNVNTSDMETYFKIGEYPLPERIEMLLSNAKTAGYFDSSAAGTFKLNAVGYNLVKHSLPREDSQTPARRKKNKKVKAKKQR